MRPLSVTLSDLQADLDDEADTSGVASTSSSCCARHALAQEHVAQLLPRNDNGLLLPLVGGDRKIAAFSRGTSYFLEDLRWMTVLLGAYCVATFPLAGFYLGLNAILARTPGGLYDGTSSLTQMPSSVGAMPTIWLNAGKVLAQPQGQRLEGMLSLGAGTGALAFGAASCATALALLLIGIASFLRRRLIITARNHRRVATTPAKFTVMVRHLPPRTTAEDIAIAFSDWGAVKEVQLHRLLDWNALSMAESLVAKEARAARAAHAAGGSSRLASRATKRAADRNAARAALTARIAELQDGGGGDGAATAGAGDALAFVSFDERASRARLVADMRPPCVRFVMCGGSWPFTASASYRRGSKLVPRGVCGCGLRFHPTPPLTLCCGAEVLPAGEPDNIEWRNLSVSRCSHCVRWLAMLVVAGAFTALLLGIAIAYLALSTQQTELNLSVSNVSLSSGKSDDHSSAIAKAEDALSLGQNILKAQRIQDQQRDILTVLILTAVVSALRKLYYYVVIPLLVRLQRQPSRELRERTAFSLLVVQEGFYLVLFTLGSYIAALHYSRTYSSHAECNDVLGSNIPGNCLNPANCYGPPLPPSTMCTTKDTKRLLAFRIADNFATYCLAQLLSGIALELFWGDPCNPYDRCLRALYTCCSRNQSTVNRHAVVEPRTPFEIHFDALTTIAYAAIVGPWWPAVAWLAFIKLAMLYVSVKWGIVRFRRPPAQYEATLLMRTQSVLRWATGAGLVSTVVLNAHLVGLYSLFQLGALAIALPIMHTICASQNAQCTRNSTSRKCALFEADVDEAMTGDDITDASRWGAISQRWLAASTANILHVHGFRKDEIVAGDFLRALKSSALVRNACYAPFDISAIGGDAWRSGSAEEGGYTPPQEAPSERGPGLAAAVAVAPPLESRADGPPTLAFVAHATFNPVVAAPAAVATAVSEEAVPAVVATAVSEEAVQSLAMMGFTDRAAATRALRTANGDLGAAAVLLTDAYS